MVYLPMSPGCGERTITFTCLIGKQLSFSNFGFNPLNEFLSICMFRLDYASVLAVNGMIPQNLSRSERTITFTCLCHRDVVNEQLPLLV